MSDQITDELRTLQLEAQSGSIPEMFRALRSPDYRLFFVGQTISLCGTWIQSIALGWLVLRLTNSPFYLGLMAVASSLPILLLSFVGGALADRVNKLRVMLVAQLISMALSVVLAVLVFQEWASIESLLLIAVLTGCVNAFEAPARQAFTIDMVGRESLLNAIALNSTIFNAARTVGPAIAGVLVASFGEGWAFVLNALSFLAVIIALTAIKQPVVEPRRESHSALGFSDCLAYINSELTIKALLFIALAFSFFGYSFLPLLPVIARDVLRSGVVELGWLSAANGLGALAAALSLCFYGERFSRGKWLVCSLTLFPCALLYFGQTKTLGPALFAMTLVGYFGVTSMALVNTIIQGTVRQEYRGRVMSVYTLALMGLSPLGGLAAGTLAHWLGDVSLVISLAAIFTALASLLALRSHPAIFRL